MNIDRSTGEIVMTDRNNLQESSDAPASAGRPDRPAPECFDRGYGTPAHIKRSEDREVGRIQTWCGETVDASATRRVSGPSGGNLPNDPAPHAYCYPCLSRMIDATQATLESVVNAVEELGK